MILPAIVAIMTVAAASGILLLRYQRKKAAETEKNYPLVHSAMEKAQQIISAAEVESLKIVAEGSQGAAKLEAGYEEELAQALGKIEGSFSAGAQQAEKEFITYLAGLRTQSQQTQNLLEEISRQKTAEVFERFEQNLVNFLTQTQAQSMNAVNLELKSARQLIDTYKAQQLALIDENIVAMLEKTLSLVLSKTLSLKDHMELVYESLEKAKVEKFIV